MSPCNRWVRAMDYLLLLKASSFSFDDLRTGELASGELASGELASGESPGGTKHSNQTLK